VKNVKNTSKLMFVSVYWSKMSKIPERLHWQKDDWWIPGSSNRAS